jgi:glycosyltransferase involved in cell wall biosynthesis
MTADFEVSVIVPVRNEEDGIRAFLTSLLQQTAAVREIIIADGGSIDRTREIIRELIAEGHSIRLIEDADAYPGRARNLAIEAAQTDWVAMTDAGTVVEADWLEQLVHQAQVKKDVAVVLGTYEPILNGVFQESLALTFLDPGRRVGNRMIRCPSTASMMLRRSVWEGLGKFPENLRACEDLLFFAKLNVSAFPVSYAPDAVVRWHIPGNFTKVFQRFRLYSLHTLKAGLGSQWHLAIGRMYVIGVIFLLLSVIHQFWWLGLPLFGLLTRVYRTIRLRKPSLQLQCGAGLQTWLLVGILILWIDFAALIGSVDYLRSIKRDYFSRISIARGENAK